MKFRKILIFITFIFGCIIVLHIPVGKSVGFLSPDNQYGVYGKPYLYTYFLSMAPGDGNSKRGKVYLFDNLTKEIIEEAEIDAISNVIDIEWTEKTAYFKQTQKPNSLEPWNLPNRVKLPYNKQVLGEKSQTIYEYDSFDKLFSIRKDTIISNKIIMLKYDSFDKLGNKSFGWEIYKFGQKNSYIKTFEYENGKLKNVKKETWKRNCP